MMDPSMWYKRLVSGEITLDDIREILGYNVSVEGKIITK